MGTARIVEDPDRIREVSRRINAKYRGEDEAGDTSSGALIDVRVGLATAQRY